MTIKKRCWKNNPWAIFVRSAREKAGVKRRSVAEAIGVHPDKYRKCERGACRPMDLHRTDFHALAKILQVDYRELCRVSNQALSDSLCCKCGMPIIGGAGGKREMHTACRTKPTTIGHWSEHAPSPMALLLRGQSPAEISNEEWERRKAAWAKKTPYQKEMALARFYGYDPTKSPTALARKERSERKRAEKAGEDRYKLKTCERAWNRVNTLGR